MVHCLHDFSGIDFSHFGGLLNDPLHCGFVGIDKPCLQGQSKDWNRTKYYHDDLTRNVLTYLSLRSHLNRHFIVLELKRAYFQLGLTILQDEPIYVRPTYY